MRRETKGIHHEEHEGARRKPDLGISFVFFVSFVVQDFEFAAPTRIIREYA